MQRIIAATVFGLSLAGPVSAQGLNVQQLLQGLTSGNQGQDQALHDAFERGYQRGRQDKAHQIADDRAGRNRSRSRDLDDHDSRNYQH